MFTQRIHLHLFCFLMYSVQSTSALKNTFGSYLVLEEKYLPLTGLLSSNRLMKGLAFITTQPYGDSQHMEDNQLLRDRVHLSHRQS